MGTVEILYCHPSTGHVEELKLKDRNSLRGQVEQPLENSYLPARIRGALKLQAVQGQKQRGRRAPRTSALPSPGAAAVLGPQAPS